jgi:hypothetical protein
VRHITLAAVLTLTTLLAACGDDDSPGETTAPAETSAGAPADVTSENFKTPVTVAINDEWSAELDTENEYILFRPTAPSGPGGVISFLYVQTVYNPENTLETEDAPADMAEWLRTHALLDVRSEEPVNIAGYTGTRLETVADNVDDFPVFELSDGPYDLLFNEHSYFYVLDVGDEQLVIQVTPENPPQFPVFSDAAVPVLGSAEIEG